MDDTSQRRFFDTAAYLTTPTFKGIYDGIKEHQPDMDVVLTRAWNRGVDKLLIPGINVHVSREALEIAKTDDRLFCTVGCSPARSHEFNKEGPSDYLAALSELIVANRRKVLALGEIGLDYRWLEICDKDTQYKFFTMQLELAKSLKIPVYLNARNSVSDVVQALKALGDDVPRGMVHSFDGTPEEAKALLDLGLYISINGCSLRTEESLEMVKTLPLERVLLETNSPWCLLKPLHAGYKYIRTTYPSRAKFHWSPDAMVRGRNEPANINQVLDVLATLREEEPNELADTIYKNAESLFFPNREV